MANGYKIQKYRVRLVKDGAVRVLPFDTMHGSTAAAAVFRSVMAGLPHEEVWVALLNAKNDIMGLVRVSQGGMHGAALKPSDVLRPVIVSGASGFVMAHNHPSGDPTPSVADIEMTRLLLKASAIVGVTCADHLIVTEKGDWQSLSEHPGLDW